MPKRLPPGLTREHVLSALAEIDAGITHPFGPPTGYYLVYEGKRYAPKAVAGLATRHLLGRMLRPKEFSSGVAGGQAVSVLQQLGFEVVPMPGGAERIQNTKKHTAIIAKPIDQGGKLYQRRALEVLPLL